MAQSSGREGVIGGWYTTCGLRPTIATTPDAHGTTFGVGPKEVALAVRLVRDVWITLRPDALVSRGRGTDGVHRNVGRHEGIRFVEHQECPRTLPPRDHWETPTLPDALYDAIGPLSQLGLTARLIQGVQPSAGLGRIVGHSIAEACIAS